jgi:hypothetical protein
MSVELLLPERRSTWQQRPDGRVTHAFEPLVLAATLALIPVLIIETAGSLRVARLARLLRLLRLSAIFTRGWSTCIRIAEAAVGVRLTQTTRTLEPVARRRSRNARSTRARIN